ncbi:epoxide hydrolase family protein [Variovorax sp. J31P207]|uniref:epoxide hydrolase family protein n=1 Tax=Variovorax sp. J31P207 TaxID=3053510 RepID=UPI002577EC07|nr:epoxide hydrolase family protein [Variovorax sp. J31P207]MDM0066072.1 epoxide hydrolase [Variovorax sp. J31P207]
MNSLEKPQSSPLSRRHFLAGSTAALLTSSSAFALAQSRPDEVAAAPVASPAGDDARVRPFTFRAPQSDLTDLRRRITSTKWPSRELVTDASQGVQLATMRELARTWQTDYDWRKFESRLNRLPQFMTTIDGVDIHFIHVRSKHPHALPVIVTHGWPGSIVEQMKIIDPLTDPTAHGGTASDAFDIVIPSLPGHGFSGKPTTLGWDPVRVARAWVVLMERLGYTRYVAQGGDWGNAVTEQMALLRPPGLVGIHTNMPATIPDDIAKALQSGGPAPAGLAADEKYAYDQLDFFYKNGLSYAQEMSRRPQTLYGIDDSPVGLAAWMLDHDARSYALISRVFAGRPEGLTRTDILDNITLYWLTNTGVSSARLYWESKLAFFAPKGVAIPVAVSAFPDEIYTAPRSWTERAYPRLVHYGRLDKGGHFAAWEQPEVFAAELRSGFRSLRG